MCGLTGYYYTGSERETNNQAIRRMLELQKHRGPDDSGAVAFDTQSGHMEEVSLQQDNALEQNCDLVFGFNRLSILDLSINGHQPMKSADGKVVLMMNGEIYNAFDFKDELIAKGYKFKSNTDTEVVLKLYLEYGITEMLQKLNGMFALVIYDKQNKMLYLARDRYGIKPMYILNEPGRMAFSSEMKSFGALPDFRFELDRSRLDEFLLFRNLIHRTLFKNIRNCTPGTYIAINHKGVSKEHSFYQLNKEGRAVYGGKTPGSFLEDALQQSVERQMISDVKLGSQLSGGVDSSLVTWYAAKSLQEGNLETISIVFNNPAFSEESYINKVANRLDLQAHKYTLNAAYYFEVMEKAGWHFEQPLNHPNTIGIYLLSQQARKHVTVLLSGEGADESLAGYSRFIHSMASPVFSRRFLSNIRNNYKNLREFTSYYFHEHGRMVMATAFGNPYKIRKLLPDFNFERAIDDRLEMIGSLSGDILQKQRKYEILTYLPDLLMRQDKMSMAHSIENRVPFLDNEMVQAALNLPARSLVNKKNGRKEGKYALKEICAEKLGDSFAYRSKMGFGIPLKEFMASKTFQQKWEEEILPGIRKRKVFSPFILNAWMKSLPSLTTVEIDMLWLMTSFEIWAKQYLD